MAVERWSEATNIAFSYAHMLECIIDVHCCAHLTYKGKFDNYSIYFYVIHVSILD